MPLRAVTQQVFDRASRLGFQILLRLALILAVTLEGRVWAQSGPHSANPAASRIDQDEAYSVLFLAADGPIWLKFQFAGKDRGIDAVRTRYAALLIQSVDADGDRTADGSEAVRLPLSGRMDAGGDSLGDGWTQFDTAPSDGRLSAREFLAAIDPMLGPRLTTRRKAPLLIQSVQLLSRLDRNQDRQISESELTDGIATLSQFDFDDDGTFSPAELQPFPQSMVDAALVAENGGPDQPFVLIDESTPADEVTARLITAYGVQGGAIPVERSGLSGIAFAALDRDGSEGLDSAELEIMLGRPRPAAEISIDLAAGRVTLVRPQRGGPRVEPLPTQSKRRLALRLGSEVVEFSARDNRYGASDQINLLRIRFLQGDADKNGYMGPDEFPTLMGLDASFDTVDADGDGKVFLDELDRFIRLDSYLAQCTVEMEVESVEKPLFGILDTNRDRRLTSREFAAGQERMQEFDRDGDGQLDALELEALRRFRVRFGFVVPPAVRPERNNQMNADRRMPVVGRMSSSGPDWFQNMDPNQDGDVTWREFLGPREAFEHLDTDGNGWIDEQEASRGIAD